MNRTIHHLKLIALACVAALSLSTCQDFFGTADLKAIIKDDVETATAESVNVTIQADTVISGGTPAPAGVYTAREGIPFNLSTSVFSPYAFKEWTVTSANGNSGFFQLPVRFNHGDGNQRRRRYRHPSKLLRKADTSIE